MRMERRKSKNRHKNLDIMHGRKQSITIYRLPWRERKTKFVQASTPHTHTQTSSLFYPTGVARKVIK